MSSYEQWALAVQGATLLVVVGTVTVYYLQLRAMRDQLRATQQAVDQNALSARTIATFRFVERWNSPEIRELKGDWHRIYEKFKEDDLCQVLELLERDPLSRDTVADVLNFFEEIALAANAGATDKRLLLQLLGETIRDYYNALLPWIERRRRDRADAWSELSKLIETWGS